MNIGLFSDTYVPYINGVSTSVVTLQKQLEKHGHTVYIITTNPQNKYIEYDSNIVRIPGILLKRLYNYRMVWIYSGKAMKLIKKMKLDIIHTHSEYGIGIFAKIIASKLQIPLVYTYHTMYEDYTHYVTKGKFDYFAKGLVGRISRYYGNTCNELISPSVKTKEALRRYGVNKYINVVPTGIDLEKFNPDRVSEETKIALRKSLKIDEDTFVFLILGRIAKEKSMDLIIRGYKRFLEKNPNRKTKLLVVGDGPDRMNLEKLAEDLNIKNNTLFLGFVPLDNVPIYYQIADVFCSASVTETQGLTFIEAMAAGIPVLACYDKNLDEILQDGVTGYFFSNEETFAEKSKLLISQYDERKEKFKQNVLNRSNRFSAETFYKNIEVVYGRAIRSKW